MMGQEPEGMELFRVFGKFLLLAGGLLILMGGLFYLMGGKLFPGKLPGDIVIRRDNWVIVIPLATSILLSVILTLILGLVAWLMNR